MAKPFDQYTYDDALKLFGQRIVTSQGEALASLIGTTELRRPLTAISATKFFEGDHWQDSKGFIGQLPPKTLPGSLQMTQDIKDAFVSENVIQEVTETHVGGILGREPLWSLLKETGGEKPEKDEETGKSLTPWWNERQALQDLQKSAETVLLEGISVRRLFIPRGRVPDGEIPTQKDVPTALDFIFFETLKSDQAGVFTDPETQKQIGVYLFQERDAKGDVKNQAAELSFLNDEGDTVCKIVRDKGAPTEFPPYRLGGRLLIHEIKRRALITEQVQSKQKALNLAHTMMMRNVNLAGSRERAVINAQPPRRPIGVQDPKNPKNTTQTEPGTWETGAGAVMSLIGWPIRNEKGEIVGYTNPNVSVHDPVPVDTFRETRDHYYEAILGECHQRHILISGDATSSAISRKQAEKSFQRSLKDTKTAVDAAGRWQIETALRLAAHFAKQSSKYLDLRADFNCLFDIGEPDPQDITNILEMRKPGGPRNEPLISDETARQKVGIEDPEAELKRIQTETPTDAEIKKRGERQMMLNPQPEKPQGPVGEK